MNKPPGRVELNINSALLTAWLQKGSSGSSASTEAFLTGGLTLDLDVNTAAGYATSEKSGYSFDVYVACKNTELESIQLEQRYPGYDDESWSYIYSNCKGDSTNPSSTKPSSNNKQFEQPCQVNVVLDSLCDS